MPGDFGDQDAEVLEAVVDVSGLDPGEQLVVRIDVRFACFGSDATGNLHAALDSVEDSDGHNIPAGRQEIPMKGLGDLEEPPPPSASPTPPGSPTPTPTPPTTPTALPTTGTPAVTPTAGPCPPGSFLDFAGLPAGTILGEQYAAQGVHISAVANQDFPDALIVFDSNSTDTSLDFDLRVVSATSRSSQTT